jgi:hypothetical protein
MGLDLYCLDKSWGSSYSGVHIVREWLIKATIKYMEGLQPNVLPNVEPTLVLYKNTCHFERHILDQENNQEYFISYKQNVLEFLNQLIVKPKDNHTTPVWSQLKINYTPWNVNPPLFDLSYFGLKGLQVFVNRSDCDGYFTVGECYDILGLLCRIQRNLIDQIIQDENDQQWILDLIELLKYSVEKKEDIIFS